MHLQQILAAADHSAEGRAAILAAARLAQAAGGSVIVLTVTEADGGLTGESHQPEGLRRITQAMLAGLTDAPGVQYATVAGLPGIEICRFAEECGADVIVMGRKCRSERQRLLIGDTADAVARRSAVPCLFVPAEQGTFTRVIAALDGTERGFAVLLAAAEFAREIGGHLRAVTVEPEYRNEIGVSRVPTGRSARLAQAVGDLRASMEHRAGRPSGLIVDPGEPLVIHRGEVVEEITREVDRHGADVLVVGYHRGGPAGVIEAGSVARRLTHETACAVLTIPL
ncbi:MAG: universal stress protein [Gemmatimonadales bacterium]